MICSPVSSPLTAYLADDPDVITAARDILDLAELITSAPISESHDRLNQAADDLAAAVINAGVRPDRASTAAADLLIHILRTGRGMYMPASAISA